MKSKGRSEYRLRSTIRAQFSFRGRQARRRPVELEWSI
jgi:hypothetical protein